MRKTKKKITTAIKNNFDLLKEANKRISELEETIVLNTCREITKPYCPMRIADLDMIEKNKKQIDVLKLNQTDGTPNQNFIAIHILKNGLTQIGLKSDNWFKKIEDILRELHELMRGLVSDLQDSDSLSKTTIECYEGKLVKNLEKLDPKSIHNDPILKECQEKFKEMEKQTEEREVCEACLYEKTFDTKICAICIPNSNKSQFKPKEKTEPENTEEEWECPICKKTVFVGYTVHRHCFDSFNKELIEGFIKKLAKLPAQNIVDEHGDNNVVIDGCWISKLSEEYEGMLK